MTLHDRKDAAAVFILRIGLVWFMFLWAVHKIIAPRVRFQLQLICATRQFQTVFQTKHQLGQSTRMYNMSTKVCDRA